MEILLDLNKHCIKTEVKRQYNKFISEYFKSQDPKLEEKIEFLKNVLENVDLIELRAKYPDLSGGSSAEIRIGLREGDLFEVSVNREVIWQKQLPTTNGNL